MGRGMAYHCVQSLPAVTVLCGGVSDADPFSGFGQGADIQRESVRMRLAEGPNGICEAGLGKAPVCLRVGLSRRLADVIGQSAGGSDGVDGLPGTWSERGAGLRMLVKIAIFVFGNTLPCII